MMMNINNQTITKVFKELVCYNYRSPFFELVPIFTDLDTCNDEVRIIKQTNKPSEAVYNVIRKCEFVFNGLKYSGRVGIGEYLLISDNIISNSYLNKPKSIRFETHNSISMNRVELRYGIKPENIQKITMIGDENAEARIKNEIGELMAIANKSSASLQLCINMKSKAKDRLMLYPENVCDLLQLSIIKRYSSPMVNLYENYEFERFEHFDIYEMIVNGAYVSPLKAPESLNRNVVVFDLNKDTNDVTGATHDLTYMIAYPNANVVVFVCYGYPDKSQPAVIHYAISDYSRLVHEILPVDNESNNNNNNQKITALEYIVRNPGCVVLSPQKDSICKLSIRLQGAICIDDGGNRVDRDDIEGKYTDLVPLSSFLLFPSIVFKQRGDNKTATLKTLCDMQRSILGDDVKDCRLQTFDVNRATNDLFYCNSESSQITLKAIFDGDFNEIIERSTLIISKHFKERMDTFDRTIASLIKTNIKRTDTASKESDMTVDDSLPSTTTASSNTKKRKLEDASEINDKGTVESNQNKKQKMQDGSASTASGENTNSEVPATVKKTKADNKKKAVSKQPTISSHDDGDSDVNGGEEPKDVIITEKKKNNNKKQPEKPKKSSSTAKPTKNVDSDNEELEEQEQ